MGVQYQHLEAEATMLEKFDGRHRIVRASHFSFSMS